MYSSVPPRIRSLNALRPLLPAVRQQRARKLKERSRTGGAVVVQRREMALRKRHKPCTIRGHGLLVVLRWSARRSNARWSSVKQPSRRDVSPVRLLFNLFLVKIIFFSHNKSVMVFQQNERALKQLYMEVALLPKERATGCVLCRFSPCRKQSQRGPR
jgi:hypothetical protein